MKRGFLLVLPVALLAVFLSLGQASAFENVGGYLITAEGKQIVVDEFVNLLETYTCKYEGAPLTIPMKRIKRLKLQGSGMAVTTTNGMTYNVLGSMMICLDDYLEYRTINTVTGESLDARIDPMLVESVVFGRKATDLKKCPLCGRTFPGEYLYCPYDKSDLKPLMNR